MFLLVSCLVAACLAGAYGVLVTGSLSLETCRDAVGLAPILRLRDSRAGGNEIVCADGLPLSERGVTDATDSVLVQFNAVLRPLGKGIKRQAFVLRGLFFQDTHIVLVGACMSDAAPLVKSSLDDARMPANLCSGVADSSRSGSPKFSPYLDDTENVQLAWQIRNPPQPSTTMAMMAGTTAACNFYGSLVDNMMDITPMNSDVNVAIAMTNSFALAEQTGLGDYVGLAPDATATDPGCSLVAAMAAIAGSFMMRPVNDSTETQRYGSLTSVLQTWSKQGYLMLNDLMGTGAPVNVHQPFITMAGMGGNVRGILSYAGYQVSATSAALGFQIECEPSAVDTTKWLTISFLGGLNQLVMNSPQDWDYNPPENVMSAATSAGIQLTPPQKSVDSQVGIRFTCQNVITETPTPPLYPRAPAPAPSDAPFPITAGAAGSVVVTALECIRTCQNPQRQSELIAKVGTVALQSGNVGANTRVLCEISPQCSEVADTASVQPLRRGLRQATSVAWLQTVIMVTRELGTAQFLVDQIRRGNLAPYINAFAALSIKVFSQTRQEFPQAVAPPAASSPIANWPSPQAEWTGSCQVYGNCRAGGCASACSNDLIIKSSDFSGVVAVACLCNHCGLVVGQVGASTQYFFQTFGCGSLGSQAAANECCRAVMQDAVCWAFNNDEVSVSDLGFISAGRWSYRPPSIGVVGPALVINDGPTSCPDSSSSNKGLLGLLGLLGIIPIVLCLLCLLLCLLRRKKREGDVHFATFDPHTLPVAMSPCPTIPAL